MELDAVDGVLAVAHGHHLAVVGRRGDLEHVRDHRRRQRVIPPRLEGAREPLEDPLAVVRDAARLAVHEALRLADLPAECLDDRLVPEAHAEGRHRGRQAPDDVDARTGIRRTSGTGGDDQVRRRELLRVVRVEHVVSDHDDLRAELFEEVRQVVREAVVVVDEQDARFRHADASASSIAASSAASLLRHS